MENQHIFWQIYWFLKRRNSDFTSIGNSAQKIRKNVRFLYLKIRKIPKIRFPKIAFLSNFLLFPKKRSQEFPVFPKQSR